MFNFDDLIGLEIESAKKLLVENGYNNIKVVINSKPNTKTDTLLVCATDVSGTFVTLICGEFYLNIKE